MQVAPATAADAAAVTEIIVAVESSFYGESTFSQADLEDEWTVLDLEGAARIVRDGERVVAFGAVHDLGERWRAEAYVHPSARGHGAGTLIATELERLAAARGARRIQNSTLEPDGAAGALLESLGYAPVRVMREMRIELDALPPAPAWPDGLRADGFDAERDGRAFHAAQEEAFADHWDYTPRGFDAWWRLAIESERFDPALWCVVRDGDEIAAGTASTGDTYGGGFVRVLFTRLPWRRRGVGAALVADALRRLWEGGERSVGLGVDAENATGAFQLYERAGMTPALGWVTYEKALG
jgi:GNAT superfamily N-acetyltransferase